MSILKLLGRIVAGAALALSPGEAAATVELHSGTIESSTPSGVTQVPVSALPATGSIPAAALGVNAGNTAYTGYDLSQSLFSISFDLDAQSHLDGFVNGSAGSGATLDFTTGQDLSYSVTGNFVDGVIGGNGNAMFQETLSEITPGLDTTVLFTKVLSPGFNFVQGDPTGSLHPGLEYELTYSADVGASVLAGEVTVTGTGNVALYLTAVPEPGTALLLACGLSGLTLAGCQRRRPLGAIRGAI